MEIKIPYGKEKQALVLDEACLNGVLLSQIEDYHPEQTESELVAAAIANPEGSDKLCQLAVGKQKIVIIASDHTRPVPSKIIMPQMLKEIRRGNPDAEITILIATGFHRLTTREELVAKFGETIVDQERIVVHDSGDDSSLVEIGTLPSGGALIINKLAAEADLLVSEGFIEPHFFAGFSGGRKSVLPGIASRVSVLANHCGEFIAHPKARTGVIEGNPLHIDMLYAARTAKLAFVVNVVINSEKEVIYAVAGDCDAAHIKGRTFLEKLCKVKATPSDIVITSNGGYPLDQNIYQAVKGMTAAEAAVKPGGVIIMLAKSGDGHGGAAFFNTFRDEKNLEKMLAGFVSTPRNETIPDQWEAQILARILLKAKVIYISAAPDEMIKEFQMTPAKDVNAALAMARAYLNNEAATVTVIPDGVAVIVE
ncbi:MAG: lactate racemization operon protein LarA [Acetobacterium sp. MES1]|uniref:nickel-dependent lactate racemase n=1 Tax=Acetobacterium sp. MES1 TaxID=1899015 RepID=UPI000B9C8BD0|nr:nickel-dependent lactate racemase [Acetobacterium sp. MES1]OXS26456.1 MAG: lactate racemization operon protein LarA [Acetobacterium sp. MES1]